MKKLAIQHVSIKNYRTFSQLDMSLHPDMTVIIGDNNAGKTSLFKAFCLIMWGYMAPLIEKEYSRPKHLKISLKDLNNKKNTNNAAEINNNIIISGYMRPVTYNNKNQSSDLEDHDYIFEYDDSFGCKFTGGRTTWFNNDTNTIDMLQTSLNSAMYYLDALTNNNQAYCEHNLPQDYPLIASFGVDRLWQSKTKKIEFKKWEAFWLIGYHGALANKTRSICIEWLYDLSYHRLPFSTEAKFHAFLNKTIESLSWSIKHITGLELHESSEPENLYFSNGDGPPRQLSDLGHGVQNMIHMVSELVIRCSLLNPHYEEQASIKTNGIVFIDEIDLHLHPEWQQKVLGQLQHIFPRIQFIVTTHSPQVLSTVPREKIRVIKHSEAGCVAHMPDFSPLAHESGAALAKVMGVHQAPPLPILDEIHKFELLVRANQEHSDEARALRSKLDAAGYQFHDSDLATWRFLAGRRAMEGKST